MSLASTGLSQPDSSQESKKSSNRVGRTLGRVAKYFREQADNQTHSKVYLSPALKEPPRTWRVPSDLSGLDGEAQHNLIANLTALANAGYLVPRDLALSPPFHTSSTRSSTSMSASSVSGPGVFKTMVRHQYASDNILQSYDVLRPERPAQQDNNYWLVYIHGGYFRDVKVDSTSFKPAIKLIEEAEEHSEASLLKQQISGYASINYRLSPHVAYPQDPSTTPSYTLNNASWPEQPNDILNALRHLHRTFPDSASNYILIGHSVGATLALLAALQTNDAGITPPKAVVGVSGIYDFPAIHVTNPAYETMTSNAMNSKYYEEASPALYSAETYREKWPLEKRLVVLAHSRDDGLVVWDQVEEMEQVLQGQSGFQTELVELKGAHNDIFGQGSELVKAIKKTLEIANS